jgi:uncharacterized membrane protein
MGFNKTTEFSGEMMKTVRTRFWEIDFLRGIAVVMMIVFHFFYDLNYFHILSLNLYSGWSLVYVYVGASIFIGLVGVSLVLSYEHAKNRLSQKELILKYVIRGLKIFGLGLVITVMSWWYLGEGFIVFGALHCIGVSIILAYPFLGFKYLKLPLGMIIIGLGAGLKLIMVDYLYLVWLGLRSSEFFTVDYFPLLPWFGVVLVGMFVGKTLYSESLRHFPLKDYSQTGVVRVIGWLGRHSLIIYLLHQPILMGGFTLLLA